MIVHEKSRNIILNLRDPDRVREHIPQAQPLDVRGHQLLAVPHNVDAVRVLRNLDIEAPPPAAHYYDYPGHYKPFAHQRATVEFLTSNPRAYVNSGLGSGKTLCGLWAFDFLQKERVVNKLLIVSPLSTLERAWGDEILRNFPDMSYTVLHGALQKRLDLLADDGFDVYIINHDGIKNARVLEAICKREDIDVVIVDELASFRNKGTDRWAALNTIINGRRVKGVPDPHYPVRPYAWGFTGTPIPNAPTDAWAQCRLINPSRAPPFFGTFRDQTMRQLTQFKWAPKPDALETVHKAMQPAIRFAREDCIDLPPTTYITRAVALTPEQ